MKRTTVLIRLAFTALCIGLMWSAAGTPVGVLALIVFANAELSAYLIKQQRQRMDRIEDAILTATEAVYDHLKRRDDMFFERRKYH